MREKARYYVFDTNEDKLEKKVRTFYYARRAVERDYADETAVPIIIFRLFEKEKG